MYLEICRRVDARTDKALKHNSSNHLTCQCPACFTHAPGEQDGGEFSVLGAMDGNNSLKHISSKVRAQLFSLFDEMGLFIACCHHQTVLYICDMVQSRELCDNFTPAPRNRDLTLYFLDQSTLLPSLTNY